MKIRSTAAEYRPDIDGLRAIAVLSVVMFHYGITSLRGGFVGVDIFFVISGYLITGLINRELVEQRFSFMNFYERRIRRIIPALIAMLVPTLVAGAWLLLPSDLERLGSAAIATLLFGANFLFWRQSGYFDSASEYNPLLHTWSLAIEEQFYIFFPILLILLHRFFKGRLKAALVGCAIGSFVLCAWVQALRPTATFFLAPFRAWELLVGSLLAVGIFPVVTHRLKREVLSVFSLLALLGSLLWIEAGPEFPGWQAAIPVLATAMLLHTGVGGATVVNNLLSIRPLGFIGKISYSLYLLHWPIVVYARYLNAMEPLPRHISWTLMGAAILLAFASYKWVESPFRRKKAERKIAFTRNLFTATSLVLFVGIGFSLILKIDDGFRSRFSKEVVSYDDVRRELIAFKKCEGRVPGSGYRECTLGEENATERDLLWGDSHALAWAPAIDGLAKVHGSKVELALHSACPPLMGVKNPVSFDCFRFNNNVLEYIKSSNIHTVYLIASWRSYSVPNGQYLISDEYGAEGNATVFPLAINRTIDFLQNHVRRIILIGPTPGAPSDAPFRLAMAKYRNGKIPEGITVQEFQEESSYFWKSVRRPSPNFLAVDPSKWFCDKDYCKYFDNEFGLLYRDGGHLSSNGAKFVGKNFSEIMDVW